VSEVANWTEEKRAAYLYRVIAASESGTAREKLFKSLAEEAETQASIWASKAREASKEIPAFVPDVRSRIVAGLVRHHGPRKLRTVLAAMKVRGMSVYAAGGSALLPHQVDHAAQHAGGVTGGGNLRAAVFGVNDGLISNASLIMGVAGASVDHRALLLTGAAGLIAGALSMAAGEYVSVRSQREMFEYQIDLERDELAEYPEEEAQELALIYEARGIKLDEARTIARRIIADPKQALDVLAREELGLNPDDLGSPWGAALFSFFSFAAGSAIPLLPLLFFTGDLGLELAIALTLIALFSVGATLSLFTGRNALTSGLRMLVIGAAAGGATYVLGRLLGVTLG
jgi:VIT1/CCC1 family predicted Fe2+/Mn2+ transporter